MEKSETVRKKHSWGQRWFLFKKKKINWDQRAEFCIKLFSCGLISLPEPLPSAAQAWATPVPPIPRMTTWPLGRATFTHITIKLQESMLACEGSDERAAASLWPQNTLKKRRDKTWENPQWAQPGGAIKTSHQPPLTHSEAGSYA